MENNTWTLLWQDDFISKEIDQSKWHLEVGYTGESNGEREIYTDRPENIRLEDSCLLLEARQEDYQGYHFTSARATTERLHSWTYGRFEARIKNPRGQGIWPAFWMLGDDRFSVGWPDCGEIDIMENIGSRLDTIRGTLHGPGYFRDDSVGRDYSCQGMNFADDFHLFAVEWDQEQILFFFDEHLYSTLTPRDLPGKWVFDHDFHILINLAVGGVWPGYPDFSTIFPQRMYVDYVRVYKKKDE